MTAADDANGHAPGWYLDGDTRVWRWWDGNEWTDATRRDSAWRMRILLTPWSYRTDRWVRNVAAVGIVVAIAVVGYTFSTGRVLADWEVLMVLGVPVALFGQFWILAVFNARYPRRTELGRPLRYSWSGPNPFVYFARSISSPAAVLLATLFFLGWLTGMTAMLSTPAGVPESARPRCPYPLNDHGSITCVSQATYDRARSSNERLAAGVLGAFFAIHVAGAAGEVNRRRGQGPSPTMLPALSRADRTLLAATGLQ